MLCCAAPHLALRSLKTPACGGVETHPRNIRALGGICPNTKVLGTSCGNQMSTQHGGRMSTSSDKQRRRRRHRPSPHSSETWKTTVQKVGLEVLGDIRASSPTLRAFRENGLRLRESYDALRRTLQRAHKQNAPQRLQHGQPAISTDVNRLLKDIGSRKESNLYAAGALVFGFGLFIAGAAPFLLPACYLIFAAVCFPWRVYTFTKRKWGFFLLDFCYVSRLIPYSGCLSGNTTV